MLQLDFVSQHGQALPLVNNSYFDLVNVDGMTTSNTTISSIVIGGIDGDTINNIQAQPRGIVIDLRIKDYVNVEDAKRYILSFIKLKQTCKLVWTQNARTLEIDGVVDSVDMPRFSDACTMQISIYCPRAFWVDINQIVTQINAAKNLHYFTTTAGDMLYFPVDGIPLGEYDTSRTRSFVNAGDVAVGMIIEIMAYSTVTNPIIYDQNGDFFGVGYGTGNKRVVMDAGDKIIINTNAGEKDVTLNGTSIIDKIKPRSTWLKLAAGANEFSINSDDSDVENMTFSLLYKQRYL
jgi:hypothetical protein